MARAKVEDNKDDDIKVTDGGIQTGNEDTTTGEGDTQTGEGDTQTGEGDIKTGNGDTNEGKEKPVGKYTEESYTVTLPVKKDDDSDVTVIVNGKVTRIKRGVEVTVTPEVYEVLKNSERMDQLAIMRRRELNSK